MSTTILDSSFYQANIPWDQLNFNFINPSTSSSSSWRGSSLLPSANNSELNYGIMIDAGSSGTRLNVYEWTPDNKNCKGIPNISASLQRDNSGKPFSIKIKGGLSNIGSPADVPQYFADILSAVKKFIPANKHKDTPIYLKGTGGLRLLPNEKAEPILKEVQRVFGGSGFLYNKDTSVKVISGENEGMFSWLSINYLTEKFNQGAATLGLLEMGGASVQVAFATKASGTSENFFKLSLNNTEHSIFSKTFSTSGANEARYNYQRTLQRDPTLNKLIDPCYIKGYTGKTKEGEVFVGTGKFQACLSKMVPLEFPQGGKNPKCNNKPNSPAIPEDMNLMVISAFAYTYEWFGCTQQPSTADCLIKKASHECANFSLEEYALHHGGSLDDYSHDYCFNAAHMITTLTKGFHIKPNRQITVSNWLGDKELSWALGAMIYEANQAKRKECTSSS